MAQRSKEDRKARANRLRAAERRSYQHSYNALAVDREIAKALGISPRERKAIHAVLKGWR